MTGKQPMTVTPAGMKKMGMNFSSMPLARSILLEWSMPVSSSASSKAMLMMLPGIGNCRFCEMELPR